ncbi:GntR family transcriptional regulator [Salinarimonas sp.]|uniref:GntR family transcriptional regulator n=1 Tax=Salinarimonas sp. TaxID=2766526 RepID=UPI0032D8EA18
MQPLASVPSRTEQVYASIRESICDGALQPGTHLVQEDLAAALGVSRQPVQQAMLLLKADGLVVEHGGRGLTVAPLDAAMMENHYQIRVVLDRLAARLTAERAAADDAFRARLRKEGDVILAEGEAAAQAGSAAEAVRHDVAFHSFVYRMSGNPLIGTTAEPHWYFLRRVMIGVLTHADRGALVWRQHRDILDALVAGDGDTAERLATDHVVGAQQALLSELAAGRAASLFGGGRQTPAR